MTVVNCARCGTTYDTDREGVTPGQDTSRCPQCGATNEVPATDGGAASGSGGATNEAVRVDVPTADGEVAIRVDLDVTVTVAGGEDGDTTPG
jgi:predicted  nucleic acid-binding Zn-ribbon protein